MSSQDLIQQLIEHTCLLPSDITGQWAELLLVTVQFSAPEIESETVRHRQVLPSSAKNISVNSIATYTIMVQTLCQDDVALYISPYCADIDATGPKTEASFCKKPYLASMDPLCVCMPALVVVVLIA